MNVPEQLKRSVWEGIRALQKEEIQQTEDLRSIYAPLLRSYRESLRRAFLGHFVIQLPKRPDGPPETVWNPLAVTELTNPESDFPVVEDVTAALLDESEQDIELALDDALVEGHRRELWLLELGGINTAPYTDSLPDEEHRTSLLLIAGVVGASWVERLARAGQDHVRKVNQWLRASVAGGRPLDETLTGIERIGEQFVNRVTGLTGNEMHRAYGLGGSVAREAAGRDHHLTEVWVTREDKIVCPICADLHLTVTLKQPVTDSHPACRCSKVSVPVNFQPTARSYADFVQELAAFESA